uniref:Reverse transcriptase zinc-binding domain-containing protein n=1 Tax=Lactuca sativa TaxID=4236 RepID=A0A9R1WB21_LACSA|nr:hypothetical protein LSAT_V11C200087120 [Lactuca sativa]
MENILRISFPRLYLLECHKDVFVAKKLRNPLVHSFRRISLGGAEAEQKRDLGLILHLVLLSTVEDRWVWLLDCMEEYSVASSHSLVDGHLLQTSSIASRWVNRVPIKVNVFSWKLVLNIVYCVALFVTLEWNR